MQKSKVVVLKTKPDSVLNDYQKLMEMVKFKDILDKNKTTILKNNISWHFPYPAANTTPWQLEGVTKTLQNAGYDKLSVVQNRTVVTNASKGEKLNKYVDIFKKYNLPVLYNFKESDMKWIIYKPKSKMLVLDKVFPEGILIPEYFLDKNIIHLPTMKCHIYSTTTGAMKNAFGGLLNTKRHYCHSTIHKTLVDLYAIQKEIHPGILAITDGTTAGNGPGPRTMTPVTANFILASEDQVAIDAISSKIMGFDPMTIEYIRVADEMGLGNGKPANIEIIGEDISNVNLDFKVGDNGASKIGDFIWFGPLKKLQRLFFHTPLVYFFIFGSAFYHDYYWYPFHGKKVVNHFEETSEWGKLFKSYKQ